LASESWLKESSGPSLRSLVVDEERIWLVDDFTGRGQ